MQARPLELVVRQAPGAPPAVQQVDSGHALLASCPRPTVAELREVEGGHVLTTADRRVYLRLDAAEHHLWTLIDGRRTVAEIATAYFLRHGSLQVGRVCAFITTLRRAGLVDVVPASFLRRRGSGLAELRWTGAHDWAAACWQLLGPMFAVWMAPLWAAVAALGALAWVADDRLVPREPLVLALGLVVSSVVHVIVHELGHAMAVVAAGRQVRHAAVGLAGISVDSTDMYLGTRAQHAVVSLAGPAATVLVTAGFALLAGAAPADVAAPLRVGVYAGAVVLGLTLYPFGPANDARRAWSDLSGEADLGLPAFAAVFAGRARRHQWIYAAMAVLIPLALFARP